MGNFEFYVELKEVLGSAATNPNMIAATGILTRDRAKAILAHDTTPTDQEVAKLLEFARERLQDIGNTAIRLEAYMKAKTGGQ